MQLPVSGAGPKRGVRGPRADGGARRPRRADSDKMFPRRHRARSQDDRHRRIDDRINLSVVALNADAERRESTIKHKKGGAKGGADRAWIRHARNILFKKK